MLWKPPLYKFDLNTDLTTLSQELGYIRNKGDQVESIWGWSQDSVGCYWWIWGMRSSSYIPALYRILVGEYIDTEVTGCITEYAFDGTNIGLFAGAMQYIFSTGEIRGTYFQYNLDTSTNEWYSDVRLGGGSNEGFRIYHSHYQTGTVSSFRLLFPNGNQYYIISCTLTASSPFLKVNFPFGSYPPLPISLYIPDIDESILICTYNGTTRTPVVKFTSTGEYECLQNGRGIILRDAGGATYPAGTRWRLRVVNGVLTLQQVT